MELLSNAKALIVTSGPELRVKSLWLHTNDFLIVNKAWILKSAKHMSNMISDYKITAWAEFF